MEREREGMRREGHERKKREKEGDTSGRVDKMRVVQNKMRYIILENKYLISISLFS